MIFFLYQKSPQFSPKRTNPHWSLVAGSKQLFIPKVLKAPDNDTLVDFHKFLTQKRSQRDKRVSCEIGTPPPECAENVAYTAKDAMLTIYPSTVSYRV